MIKVWIGSIVEPDQKLACRQASAKRHRAWHYPTSVRGMCREWQQGQRTASGRFASYLFGKMRKGIPLPLVTRSAMSMIAPVEIEGSR
jgi:hypothetical protein